MVNSFLWHPIVIHSIYKICIIQFEILQATNELFQSRPLGSVSECLFCRMAKLRNDLYSPLFKSVQSSWNGSIIEPFLSVKDWQTSPEILPHSYSWHGNDVTKCLYRRDSLLEITCRTSNLYNKFGADFSIFWSVFTCIKPFMEAYKQDSPNITVMS